MRALKVVEQIAEPEIAEAESWNGRLQMALFAPNGVSKLRELILELAIRGKLVSQNPKAEPAQEIVKRIKQEKFALIKKGKLKDKPAPNADKMDKPFEIPKSWEWSTFPDVAHYKVGKTPPTKNSRFWSDNEIPWVSISDMSHYGQVLRTERSVSAVAQKDIFKYPPVPAGTILMSFKLTVGKVSFLNVDGYHNEAIISVTPYTGIDKNFLFRFLPLIAQTGRSKNAIKGNTLNSESISELLVPIPPLEEQERIVSRVDELMALCDTLEMQKDGAASAHETLVKTLLGTLTKSQSSREFQENWQRIAKSFNILFTTEASIDALKQAIMQLAVMGKLGTQIVKDETSERFLKRSNIKVSELKYEKGNPVKLPQIPQGWCWINLVDIVSIINSGWSPACLSTPSPNNRTWGVLKTTSVQTMQYLEYENKELPENLEPRPEHEVQAGDILITRAGPKNRVGISCFVHETRPRLMISDKIIRFHLATSEISAEYITLCLNAGATSDYLERAKSGMAESQMNISQDKLKLAPIPLAPCNEQHRIVARVKELAVICDDLKTNLGKFNIIHEKLATALVEKAVAA